MGRWSISFRSSDFNGDDRRDRPKQGRRQSASDLLPPLPGEGRHLCPRGVFCAGATRDAESGEWHPMPVNAGFCPADVTVIDGAVPLLPGSYARLEAQMTGPLRSNGPSSGGRRPPGSRVLLSSADDALLRESAAVLGGWAARVRVIPGVQLSARRHWPDTLAGVTESCGVLATWTTQLLALPPGPTLRTWEYAPGRPDPRPAAPSLAAMGAARSESLGLGGPRPPRPGPAVPAVPCRRCGTFVVPSPSGKYWWPAVCTHAIALPSAWAEDKDGTRYAAAWACAECSTPFRGSPPRPRPACAHEPSARAPERPGGIPDDIEAQIEGLEVVRAGDGWVTCVTDLSGVDAGLDLLDLAAKFRRRLRENPAPAELLDGIPCRRLDCDVMGLERAPFPSGPAGADEDPPFSRCPACGDIMAAKEYREWTVWYAKWAEGSADPVCVRCQNRNCTDCLLPSCECRARGHAAA